MFQWLNNHKNIHTEDPFKYSCKDIEHIFTDEFKKLIFDLEDVPGVYSFWVGDTVMYIGTSINLQSRILGSFNERFCNNTNQIYLRYIRTSSKSDACILEVYLICKLNPPLNEASNYGDEVTLKLLNEPEFSEPVPCNIVV